MMRLQWGYGKDLEQGMWGTLVKGGDQFSRTVSLGDCADHGTSLCHFAVRPWAPPLSVPLLPSSAQ